MQIFGKMAKKLARGAISKFCFPEFLDIVVPYQCAKFGEDRFGNGGAEFFLLILHGPPIETTSPIHIYKDRLKNMTSGVGILTPQHLA